MSLGGRKWPAAAAVIAGGLFALLLPLPIAEKSRATHALAGAFHVLLFAVLAGMLRGTIPARIPGWLIWLGLVFAAGAIEWLQPFLGRSAEWSDWVYGAAGAACFSGRRLGLGGLRRRWLALGLLLFFPVGWELTMWHQESKAFPVLAQPGTMWARRGWTLNDVQLSVTVEKNFRVENKNTKNKERPLYPGLFRASVTSDWCNHAQLQTALYWPTPQPAIFALRIDDAPNNPPYAERFQKEFAVSQGWNHVEISPAEWGYTSGGRPMNLQTIHQWGVFLVSTVPLEYFLLAPVRLIPSERKHE